MADERIHDPVTRECVPGGWRFMCQQCGAEVGVPVALVAQWEREQRLDDEIQPRLTRTLLLRTHRGRQIHHNDPLWHADEPRAIVQAFALAMERNLAANDGVKGGWRDGTGWNPQVGLRQKLQEEVGELSDALEAYLWRDGSEEDVLLEAADVANVAMMLADIVGALPPTDERGR